MGPRYPNTAGSLNNLAVLYDAQGNYEQAEPLMKQALKILEQSIGTEHPNTKQGRKNYAGLLRKLGREEEAVVLEAEGQ